MIDLPGSATFLSLISEGRFFLAILIAAVAGAARGFAGFGSALIFVPLISALYDPKLAVACLVLLDFLSGAPFAFHAFPKCNWRDAGPLSFASILTVPIGTMLLILVSPIPMRWAIGTVILVALPFLAGGWRYHHKPTLPVTLLVGAVAGVLGGATQISGPVVVLYWLGGLTETKIARANLIVFLAINEAATLLMFIYKGLFTAQALALFALLVVPYTAPFLLGAFSHHRASESFYRKIAYTIIGIAGVISLPLFDRFFH
jgi:uncharacterized protein